MARSKRISAYSPDLVQVAMRSGPRAIRLKFPDKKAAEAMRLNFYGLRGAIAAEGGGEPGDVFSGFMDSQLTIRPLSDGRWELCLAPPEFQDEQAQATLKAALAVLDAEQPQPAPQQPGPAEPDWPPPPPADPYEAFLYNPSSRPAPPEDPFDLAPIRARIDGFEAAVTAWLAGPADSKKTA